MTEEKKSERLEIRVGYSEKKAFVDACDSQGDTPSGAMRRFIRGYVRRADADVMASAWRGMGRGRRGLIVGSGIGLMALAVAAGLLFRPSNWLETTDMEALNASLAQPPSPRAVRVDPDTLPPRLSDRPMPNSMPEIDRALFARLDRDESGLIEKGEILPSDHHLHRVLDIDGKPGISPEELYATGTMQYRIAEGWELFKAGESYQLQHSGKLETIDVTFDLRADRPIIYAFQPLRDAVIARHDRTVIWTAGDPTPFSTWSNDTHAVRAPA